jgi:hypothetical protein
MEAQKRKKEEIILPHFSRIPVYPRGAQWDSRVKVIKTRGTAGILRRKGAPAAIPRNQMDAIQKLVDKGKVWKA